MTDQDIIKKLNRVAGRVTDFFNSVNVIPESYKKMKEREKIDDDEHFYRNLWLKDKNHKYKTNQNMFSFSADEIQEWQIPIYVVGCSGRAKMFAKYAQEEGLENVFIVPTVLISDIGKKNMRGHQIIAVKMSDGHWQLVNPNKSSFSEGRINENFEFGKDIDALNRGIPEFRITVDKPLTPKEHDEIDSPEKLQAIYAMKKHYFDSASKQTKGELLEKIQSINLANYHQNN
jgi:hypothetical protein